MPDSSETDPRSDLFFPAGREPCSTADQFEKGVNICKNIELFKFFAVEKNAGQTTHLRMVLCSRTVQYKIGGNMRKDEEFFKFLAVEDAV